eukprot:jgi/Ulvmu1/11348/UM075_0008.1
MPRQKAQADQELADKLGDEQSHEDEDTDMAGSEDSEDEVEDSSDGEEEPSTPPPPIELPNRTTRGKRMQEKVAEEQEEADNDFWCQEFFAEENADTDYSAESDDKDSVDEDFDDAESEDEEDDNTEEAIRSVLKLKKSKQLPPGYRQAALRKAAQQRAKRQRDQAKQGPEEPSAPVDGPSSRRSSKEVKEKEDGTVAEGGSGRAAGGKRVRFEEAPVLRRSTYARGQQEAAKRQSAAPRKRATPVKSKKDQLQSLVMVDVLKRAAADQLANTASLEAMLMREENLKARALAMRPKQTAPRIRWRSFSEATAAAAPTPSAGAAHSMDDPAAGGGGEQGMQRVSHVTAEFVDMPPDAVPALYRPQHVNTVFRPPADVCMRPDGTAQPRVRRLAAAESAGATPPQATARPDGTQVCASMMETSVLRRYGDIGRMCAGIDGMHMVLGDAGCARAALGDCDSTVATVGASPLHGGLQGTLNGYVGGLDLGPSGLKCTGGGLAPPGQPMVPHAGVNGSHAYMHGMSPADGANSSVDAAMLQPYNGMRMPGQPPPGGFTPNMRLLEKGGDASSNRNGMAAAAEVPANGFYHR